MESGLVLRMCCLWKPITKAEVEVCLERKDVLRYEVNCFSKSNVREASPR